MWTGDGSSYGRPYEEIANYACHNVYWNFLADAQNVITTDENLLSRPVA
jgi:hypothetical protein